MSRKTFTPTTRIVNKIISFCDAGLCTGMGGTDRFINDTLRVAPKKGAMCVEAAVWAATEDDGKSDLNDHPTCVNDNLANFKIGLNDEKPFQNNKQRGDFLRRIAIAQLGTHSKGYTFNFTKFEKRLKEITDKREELLVLSKLSAAKDIKTYRQILDDYQDKLNGNFYEEETLQLATYIEDAVQVLREMKTPGSKFLHLAKLPKILAKYTPIKADKKSAKKKKRS